VFVELPQVDQTVQKGDPIGAVESVKSASDILTPVSGTVVAVNEKLDVAPRLINQGAETQGWIARIELSRGEELDGLMSEEEYAKSLQE
jgi:glycine cleavage system H protein